MGYYLNSNVAFDFNSDEALIQAAHRLAGEDAALVSDAQGAWQVVINAWEECGENAELTLPSDEDGAASPLAFYGWSSGKWYSSDYERFSNALLGLVTGVADFNEDVDLMWRERFHADGTITEHQGKIVYEGDNDVAS